VPFAFHEEQTVSAMRQKEVDLAWQEPGSSDEVQTRIHDPLVVESVAKCDVEVILGIRATGAGG
jgi:hypothetical protein